MSNNICRMINRDLHDMSFQCARPIWPAGIEREMNCFVGFRTLLAGNVRGAVLRITASTLYRAFLNGRFIGYGPARAAHGYFRVDEWSLQEIADRPQNLLAIEVAGYNINSYYTLDQPSFLLAEVTDGDGNMLAATAHAGRDFDAVLLRDHVQRVERYSVARTFSEIFALHGGWNEWRSQQDFAKNFVACAVQPPVQLLARRLPYPDFEIALLAREIASGTIRSHDPPGKLHRDWTLTAIGQDLKGFTESEIPLTPSLELQKLQSSMDQGRGTEPLTPLVANRFRILDFEKNLTGFIRVHFTCESPLRLAVVFDEILSHGDVSFNRLRCNNIIWIDAEPGEHRLESFEPYTLRYLKLMCLDGECDVKAIELRRYEHPPVMRASLNASDDRLNRIFDAAVATFRQNAVDLPTDCPSRERAGWLCDSFYICRTAFDLTGTTTLERNFLENYLLPDRFDHLPEGMVAMNYPADHPNGKFIPNWALWLVLQLEEYQQRSGDHTMIAAFSPRVEKLLQYFDRFRNPQGLLEKLESWIFVEWSAANDFVQDVNFPTNMLYAGALDAAARMYHRGEWADQASRLRQVIGELAFDGSFFVDNALRSPAALTPTQNRTEVCQYYAFYFDVATPTTHAGLWKRLVSDFGRRTPPPDSPLHPANALMGWMMRLELLSRYGTSRQVCDQIIEFFLPMADQTGTLWEHSTARESCCHGFASYVASLLLRHASDGSLASNPTVG